MGALDRRTFLKMVGAPAVGAALPAGLDKALAIPANNRHGSIADVEHVIFLMQENRSFDHYFGTLRGVRGFADPHPVNLPTGKSVFHQPNGTGELLPFRPQVPDLGQTFLPDPPHGWNDGHAAWNEGRHDQWVPNKGVTAMTYHTRADLPYQFALADAFTVCDNYHCSLLGPTDPNRYHMWSGWVGNDGKAGGPVITNAEAGYDWSTYPERLERNGISWKIYQDVGLGLTAEGFWGWTGDPYIGNYGDNSLLYFHQYQNAKPGSPLAEKAKRGTEVNKVGRDPLKLLADLRSDVEHNRMPKVSWIVAPEAFTEHPNWEPAFGAWYVSQVIDILASNPEVWSKMALFITYDEEGGFFDHMPPPTPGLSTVSTVNEIFPGDANNRPGPYGLGMRVPMIIVSPWTRGGWVNSEVFDHTSLIRFMEARFAGRNRDLVESNITPWRRAVAGNLTSAFDFKTPNRSTSVKLPDTDDFKPDNLVRFPDQVPVPPADQAVPRQEKGVKPARALPYTLEVSALPNGLEFRNRGQATAVFQVREAGSTAAPRSYTVEPGKHVSDTWAKGADLTVHGPNGFFRRFAGNAGLSVSTSYDERHLSLDLTFANHGKKQLSVTVRDGYRGRPVTLSLRPGEKERREWSLTHNHGWYDLSVSVAGNALFERRLAGHLENGEDSFTDPAMGGLV